MTPMQQQLAGMGGLGMKGFYSQTHLSALLRLVMIKTFPAALAMGMAQHTTLGVERFLAIG